MTKEIILPIKCSTVKWLEIPLLTIIAIEMNIYAALTIFVAITTSMVGMGTLMNMLMLFGLVTTGITFALDSLLIVEHLPTISCIKDDDTPKQERD